MYKSLLSKILYIRNAFDVTFSCFIGYHMNKHDIWFSVFSLIHIILLLLPNDNHKADD